jgi:hypothetical protein
MTTQETFEILINQRGIHHRLEITNLQVRTYRHQFKLGKLSINKQEEILRSAGYEKIIPEQWGILKAN